MDGSMLMAETLEDLFNNADASDYLAPFKEATGASEVDDLLDSADKEIDEWLDDLRMKPLVHKRLMRHIQKARELKASMSAGDSLGTGKTASPMKDSGGSSTNSGRKKNSSFFSGWMGKSKPQPTSSAAPASAPIPNSEPISRSPLVPTALEELAPAASDAAPPPIEQDNPSGSVEGSDKAKKYAVFLSIYDEETKDESQVVMDKLVKLLPPENNACYLSNNNPTNFSDCADYVKNSACLVLVQSKSVLISPRCLFELYTACTNEVPVVALDVQGSHPYNAENALGYLTHLDERMPAHALNLLVKTGVNPLDAARWLSSVVPAAPCTPFHPKDSKHAIDAAVEDLFDTIVAARPAAPPTLSFSDWRAQRKPSPSSSSSTSSLVPADNYATNPLSSLDESANPMKAAESTPPALARPVLTVDTHPHSGGDGSAEGGQPNHHHYHHLGGADEGGHHHLHRVMRGEWRRGENIGQGAFGVVYKGLNLTNGEIVAIKELHYDPHQRKQLAGMVKEVKLMRRLAHPNIVKYLGGQEEPTKGLLYIFTEYVAGGSVDALLKQYGPLGSNVVARYAAETLAGLIYLHANGIVHRDIKPANVLVSQQGVAKLADFGASQFKPGYDASPGDATACLNTTRAEDANSLAGTPYFMSPEAVAQKSCGRRADVWSFGGFVLNMATGKPPWRCLNLRGQFQLFTHVTTSAESPLDAEDRVAKAAAGKDAATTAAVVAALPADLRAFLTSCFERHYQSRPLASALEDHPFLLRARSSDDSSDEDLGDTTAGIEALLAKANNGGLSPRSPALRTDGKPLPVAVAQYVPSNATATATPASSSGSSSESESDVFPTLESSSGSKRSTSTTTSSGSGNQASISPATSVSASTPPMTPPSASSSSSSSSRDASGNGPPRNGAGMEAKGAHNADKRVNPFKKKSNKPAAEEKGKASSANSSFSSGAQDQHLPRPKPASPPPKPPPWPDSNRPVTAPHPMPPSAGPSISSISHGHSATDAVNLGSVSVEHRGKETTEFAQITAPLAAGTAAVSTVATATEPSSRRGEASEREAKDNEHEEGKEEIGDEPEGEEVEEGAPPMSIEIAAELNLISPTDYMNLSRAGIFVYDPKRPPAICSGNGGGSIASGLDALRSLRR